MKVKCIRECFNFKKGSIYEAHDEFNTIFCSTEYLVKGVYFDKYEFYKFFTNLKNHRKQILDLI